VLYQSAIVNNAKDFIVFEVKQADTLFHEFGFEEEAIQHASERNSFDSQLKEIDSRIIEEMRRFMPHASSLKLTLA
jgi:hypothetical protein